MSDHMSDEEWENVFEAMEDDWQRKAKPSDNQPLITRVTQFARRTVQDLESARAAYALLPEDARMQAVDQAYGYMNLCRRDLYCYIAELERIAGIKHRNVNLRF